jgi:hypothetical protein
LFIYTVQGAYNDFLVGATYSHDRDLSLDNFRVEAGYFVYPWLFAKVGYVDIAKGNNQIATVKGGEVHQPQVIPAISALITPSVSLTGTYTIFTKSSDVLGDVSINC